MAQSIKQRAWEGGDGVDVESEELKIVDISEVDKDNILNDAVFYWLFDMDDEVERFRTKSLLEELARGYKCLTEFKGLFTAHQKEYNKQQKEIAESAGNDNKKKGYKTNFGDKYPMLYSGVWIADKNGVYTYSEKGKTLACYHPITIVNFFENAQTGEEKVRIAFKRNGRWKEITPNKDVISSNSKIVSLANAGLSVTSETSRALVRYLSDLEGLNASGIPVKVSTTKLGWMKYQDELKFIPYDDDITFDGEEKFKNVFESVSSSGEYADWVDYVKNIREDGRLEPRIMLAASFASVLVSICNALPFIVNLHGLSEGGKTVSLMLAASVWGNPDKDSGYMGDFLTTPVAIEARADLLNHLPMILDDTSKVSKRMQDDFSELVYTLCNGTGKDRSNQSLGLRRTNNWTNCALTSGEHPIISDTAQGGAINRVIEVTTEMSKIFPDGHAAAEFFKGHYGHAGRRFVDAIKDAGIDKVKEMQRYYEKMLMEDKDRLQKQCISMSLILTADTLASGYIFEDSNALTTEDVAKFIKKESDISEDEKCLEYLYGKIVENQGRFVTDESSSAYPEVWGRISERENRVYIIQSTFERIIRDAGYSPKSFSRWADAKGLIKHEKNRNYRSVRIIPGGKPIRVFDIEWKDNLDDFDEIPDEI